METSFCENTVLLWIYFAHFKVKCTMYVYLRHHSVQSYCQPLNCMHSIFCELINFQSEFNLNGHLSANMKAIDLKVKLIVLRHLGPGDYVIHIANSMDLAESTMHTIRKKRQNKVHWLEYNNSPMFLMACMMLWFPRIHRSLSFLLPPTTSPQQIHHIWKFCYASPMSLVSANLLFFTIYAVYALIWYLYI